MAHADNLRRHFPASRLSTYLATAGHGLLPDAAVQAMQSVLEKLLQEGRNQHYTEEVQEAVQGVRQELASLFHVDAQNFALMPGLSSAVHTVLYGLDLQPGDEILFHPALDKSVLTPLFAQRQSRLLSLRMAPGGVGSTDWSEVLQRCIHRKTRLIVWPQVSPRTGQTMELDTVADLARHHGIPVLADGTFGAGAVQLDMEKTAVDFYLVSGDRWLSGPDGAAALYIADDWLYRLRPGLAGKAALKESTAMDLGGAYLPVTGAGRFEGEVSDLLKWKGLQESLHFLRVTAGWDYIFTRIQGLTAEILDALLDVNLAEILTPRELRAGMVSLQLPRASAEKLMENAANRKIAICRYDGPDFSQQDTGRVQTHQVIQLSCGIFNHSDDVERAVRLLAASGSQDA